MNSDEIKNAVQVAMTLIGGVLLSHGYVTSDEWTGLTGAFLAAVGPVWSIFVDHWNMKKVPENAKVVGGMILLAILIGLGSPASAANLSPPVYKAPVASAFTGYPYGTSGLFFGVFTEAGGGPVNGSVPGVASTSLTTTQASVGATIGYAWGQRNSPVAYSVEADFGVTNFNGNAVGFSLSGPLAFEQRFVAFTPLGNLLSYLPNLPNVGQIPPFNALPNGITASNLQTGIMFGLDENDISANFPGIAADREWRFAPMIGIVAMEQTSNNGAIRAWAKTIFPDKSVCVGPVGTTACSGVGQQVKVGFGVYF